MKKIFIYLIIAISLISCINKVKIPEFKCGTWRGVLKIDTIKNGLEVPFNFIVMKSEHDSLIIEFINAKERIKATNIIRRNDSVFIRMPLYDSEFKAKIDADTIKGLWIDYSRENYTLPFIAYYNVKERFIGKENSVFNISGQWGVTFYTDTKDSSDEIGSFKQDGNIILGTFLSGIEDKGELEGIVTDNKMFLSSFNGAHAWLYTAQIKNENLLEGMFYSGKHYHQSWKAIRNKPVKLENPDSLTFLKKGVKILTFNLKDLNGKSINQTDFNFKDKLTIIQIMGTWCPDCMNETKFFTSLYKKYNAKGLQIFGVAFEKIDDINKAKINIQRVIKNLHVDYNIYYGGKADPLAISKAFPEIENFECYPTTIFIDKNLNVIKIHAGFFSQAEQRKNEKQKEELIKFIEKLLDK